MLPGAHPSFGSTEPAQNCCRTLGRTSEHRVRRRGADRAAAELRERHVASHAFVGPIEPGAAFVWARKGVAHDAVTGGLTMGTAPRTVLIVDDHASVRAAARLGVEAAGLEIVGEAADGEGALAAVAAITPDVVLLDVQLPGLDGIAVAELLAARETAPCVVLMSSSEAASYGERLERAPVRGFIPKQRLTRRALAAILG
jgi:CheY-like chemotaxis protein